MVSLLRNHGNILYNLKMSKISNSHKLRECVITFRMEGNVEIRFSIKKQLMLYRISSFQLKKNPVEALEGILDEVISLFGASSASISLINADSDKLLIEVERDCPRE